MARVSHRLWNAAAYDGIQAGLERLRTDGWLIAQTAGAAAIAWLLPLGCSTTSKQGSPRSGPSSRSR